MKYQKGVAGYVFLGVVALIAAVVVGSYVTNANYGNRAERTLEATRADNMNIRSTHSLKIMELAQIPQMYKNDVIEIYTAAISTRYGEDGSQAMFQFLKEQNPNIDASIYKAVQQEITAGRNEFKVAQSRLLDQKRVYVTNLGYVWKGFWLEQAGYPMLNVGFQGGADDFEIVLSGDTNEIFESGVDKPLVISQ